MRILPILLGLLGPFASAQPLVPVPVCALDSVLHEASGLILVDGLPWLVLDSGNPNALFQVDPVSGAVARSITVTNATNTDWEALTRDAEWVYIGDFGNNGGDRTDLRIYRIPLSALQTADVTEVLAETIMFSYPDQTDFTTAYDANNWDCEALVARDDSVYLFSKNWLTSDCYLYALYAEPGVRTAIRRDTLASDGLITGASQDASTNDIALIGHTTGYDTFVWRLTGSSGNALFNGIAERHAVVALPMQAEGIAWAGPDSVRFCTEASGPLPGRLWRMDLPFADGIGPLQATTDLHVRPTLATDELLIESGEPRALELRDTMGRTVAQWQVPKGTIALQVGHLCPGRYTLRAGSSATVVTVTIVR